MKLIYIINQIALNQMQFVDIFRQYIEYLLSSNYINRIQNSNSRTVMSSNELMFKSAKRDRIDAFGTEIDTQRQKPHKIFNRQSCLLLTCCQKIKKTVIQNIRVAFGFMQGFSQINKVKQAQGQDMKISKNSCEQLTQKQKKQQNKEALITIKKKVIYRIKQPKEAKLQYSNKRHHKPFHFSPCAFYVSRQDQLTQAFKRHKWRIEKSQWKPPAIFNQINSQQTEKNLQIKDPQQTEDEIIKEKQGQLKQLIQTSPHTPINSQKTVQTIQTVQTILDNDTQRNNLNERRSDPETNPFFESINITTCNILPTRTQQHSLKPINCVYIPFNHLVQAMLPQASLFQSQKKFNVDRKRHKRGKKEDRIS